MEETYLIAPPDSVKGLLQRGRGLGYLEVLKLPAEQAHSLIYDCILNDPRMDRDCEERCVYYAGIAIEIRLPLAPLRNFLTEKRHEKQVEAGTKLAVTTLIELAKYNYEDSLDILSEYLSWGEMWTWVIEQPALTSSEFAEVCAKAIEQRFPSDEELEEAIKWCWFSDCSVMEKSSSRFRKARVRTLEALVQRPKVVLPDISQMSLDSIFKTINAENFRAIAKVIGQVVSPKDMAFLLRQLDLENPLVSKVALAGLEYLATPNILAPVLRFWRLLSHKSKKPRDRSHPFVRQAIYNLVLALPASETLPLARRWVVSKKENQRELAEKVLIRHATHDDIPTIRSLMRKILTDEGAEWCCFILRALNRFPNLGHVPELEQIYRHVRFARARVYAVEAWLVTCPETFALEYANECLWDCEAEIREMAVAHCPITPQNITRIRELAGSPMENEKVRLIAQRRLEATC